MMQLVSSNGTVLLEQEKPGTKRANNSTLHVRRMSQGIKKTVRPVLMSKEEFFDMKTDTKNIFTKAAVVLLMMMLTTATAWAQTLYNINTYLSPTYGGSITGYPTSAAANTSITFTVYPNIGYMIESVTVRKGIGMQAITDLQVNTVPGQETAQSYTFSMPASLVTIEATFTANLNVQTAVTPSGAGTASYNALTHKVTANPNSGYVFKHWNFTNGITEANNLSTDNPYTVTQSGTYTAVFEEGSNGGEGTYSGTTKSCNYVDENGVQQTVTAYIFDKKAIESGNASIGADGLTLWLCDVSIGTGQTLNLSGDIRVINLNIVEGCNLNVNGSLTVYGQGYGTQPNPIRGNIRIMDSGSTMTINGSSYCILGTIYNNGIFNVNNAQFMIAPAANVIGGTCTINLSKDGYFFINGTFASTTTELGTTLDWSFYRDGKWNTMCLSIALGDENAADGHHFDYTPFEGATVMELDTETAYNGHVTGISNGTLYLNFKTATSIEAGKPYIVKWASDDTGYKHLKFCRKSVTPTEVKFPGGKFLGIFYNKDFEQTDKSVLFLGADNKLYYPKSGAQIPCCHAYFQLNDGITVDDVTSACMFFDENEATGIRSLSPDPSPSREGSEEWYSLDGRKLDQQPTQKGVYIHGGRKVVIK
jgi:hypothetical protein